jgi:hypothetical protein
VLIAISIDPGMACTFLTDFDRIMALDRFMALYQLKKFYITQALITEIFEHFVLLTALVVYTFM